MYILQSLGYSKDTFKKGEEIIPRPSPGIYFTAPIMRHFAELVNFSASESVFWHPRPAFQLVNRPIS
jgi:hypothetical protein